MAYTPRLTAPDASDLRWIKTTYGGYNQCLLINSSTGQVIPNCTGYVHGRVMEMNNLYADVPLSLGNGAEYWGHTSDGYERGSEPKLGAVICFYQGNASNQQPGHVAIVEQIIDADTIVTSDSNYGAEYFVTRTRRRSLGWNWYNGSPLVFQGFIYTYDEGGEPPTPPTPRPLTEAERIAMYGYIMKRRKRGEGY